MRVYLELHSCLKLEVLSGSSAEKCFLNVGIHKCETYSWKYLQKQPSSGVSIKNCSEKCIHAAIFWVNAHGKV